MKKIFKIGKFILIFLLIVSILSFVKSCTDDDPVLSFNKPGGKFGDFLEDLADLFPGGFIGINKEEGAGNGNFSEDGEEPDCEHIDKDKNGFCDKCGGKISDGDDLEEPSINEHNCNAEYESVVGYPANCKETGLLPHLKCTACGKLFSSDYIQVTIESLILPKDLNSHGYPRYERNDEYTHFKICSICEEYKVVENCRFNTHWLTNNEEHYNSCVCGNQINNALHEDEDDDLFCDVCGFDLTPEEPECEHIDEDSNGFCDYCGVLLSEGEDPDEPDNPGEEPGEPDEPDNPGGENPGQPEGPDNPGGEEPEQPGEPEEPECEFVDEDNDGYCDNCGEEKCVYEDRDGDGYCDNCGEKGCEHRDSDSDGYCDDCGGEIYGFDGGAFEEESWRESWGDPDVDDSKAEELQDSNGDSYRNWELDTPYLYDYGSLNINNDIIVSVVDGVASSDTLHIEVIGSANICQIKLVFFKSYGAPSIDDFEVWASDNKDIDILNYEEDAHSVTIWLGVNVDHIQELYIGPLPKLKSLYIMEFMAY